MTQTPLRFGYLPLADSIATLLCCGEMTKEGFPWEPVKFANNHLLLEAFKKGEIDGGISSAVFLPELEQDRGVKIMGAASREGVRLFASQEGKLKEAFKLKGAVVALPAKMTVHGALLYKVLQRQRLTWGQEVTVKYLPPAEGFKALAEGAVDLVLALEPLASRIEAEGKFSVWSSSPELWPGHLSFVALISVEKIKQNPWLENKWRESYANALGKPTMDYQAVAQETAPRLGVEAALLQRTLQPPLRIRYDQAALGPEESKEWRELVEALKSLV